MVPRTNRRHQRDKRDSQDNSPSTSASSKEDPATVILKDEPIVFSFEETTQDHDHGTDKQSSDQKDDNKEEDEEHSDEDTSASDLSQQTVRARSSPSPQPSPCARPQSQHEPLYPHPPLPKNLGRFDAVTSDARSWLAKLDRVADERWWDEREKNAALIHSLAGRPLVWFHESYSKTVDEPLNHGHLARALQREFPVAGVVNMHLAYLQDMEAKLQEKKAQMLRDNRDNRRPAVPVPGQTWHWFKSNQAVT